MTLVQSAQPLFQRQRVALAKWVALAAVALGFVAASTSAAALSLTVTSPGDVIPLPAGLSPCSSVPASCTLRAALAEANNFTGPHAIVFAPAVTTVTLANGGGLQIQAPVTITGAAVTRTVINGGNLSCFSLTDASSILNPNGANGSILSNLVIQNCNSDAISANGHGFTFINNFIGTNQTGTAAVANTGHGISVSSSRVYPILDFNSIPNISSALTTLYSGFPTLPLGTQADISNFSAQLVTALTTLTAPVKIINNVISGNGNNGIEIFSQNLAATIVSGNMIGTDVTGSIAIANGKSGIRLTGSTFANLIGPGNVISGNTDNGISVESGAVYLPNFIMGNRIGLSSTNVGVHIGNNKSGITTDTKPDTAPTSFNPSMISLVIGPANLISDNKGVNNNINPDQLAGDFAGIVITGASKAVKVIGNTIGMGEFPPGTPIASKAFGNAGDGIIVTTSGNTIGGSTPAAGNNIAGNARHGIVVKVSSTTANSILGNSIGVHALLAGDLTVGNGVDGIHINAASSTTMGGTGATDFNVIAGNGRNGVKLRAASNTNGWSNLLQRNRVYSNAKLLPGVGIDIDHPENATDPAHSESPTFYANLDQSSARICSGAADTGTCAGSATPASTGGNTTLDWVLATHGPANFRAEFFQINAADDNTATSMNFLGEQLFSTDLLGVPANGGGCSGGRCSVTLAASTTGSFVVMTVSDITPLIDQPGPPGDWKAGLQCFIGNLGVILSACNVNNTSELSNVMAIPALPPSATSVAATAITMVAATLNGTVSANGALTTVTFEYGLTNTYGGAGSPLTATQSPLALSATGAAVSVPLAGLTCGTTYHFRVNANNGVGSTVNGADLTFNTVACPIIAPTATTTAATSLNTSSATVNGTVTANGALTTVTFEYGLTNTYGGAGSPVTATQSPLAIGSTNAPVSAPLSGLVCNTQYHFRVTANNGVGGTINGNDLTFTTTACAPVAPTAVSVAASGITTTAATVNGTVTSNGALTTVTFEYGLTNAYGGAGSPVSATQSPVAANAVGMSVSAPLSGLTCATTYHYRVNANNGVGGTINGGDLTFATAACPVLAPTATSAAASAIAVTNATLNGTVTANGALTTVTFDYGLTNAYGGAGSPLTATQSPVAANAVAAAVSVPVSSLICNTTYHFRVNANNGVGGTINGGDLFFTTAACAPIAPTATTAAATGLAATAATLNGTASANGASTVVKFEYGLTNAYGGAGSPLTATQSPLASGSINAPVSVPVAALTCNTLYHFRVTANNGVGGTINGNDLTFTTAACPALAPTAITGAASAVTATNATLSGTVSANGASPVVMFEYGLTVAYGAVGSPIAAAQSPLAIGASNAPVSVSLAALACNTTYHYRVTANNGVGGTVNGGDQSFKTATCPTTTAITAHTPNPSTTLQLIAVTATVSTAAPGMPGGSIAVSDGTGAICTITLPATSCNLAATSAGGKTLTAVYSGDANFAASGAIGVAHTVTAVLNFSSATATGTGTATATVTGAGCTFTTAQFIAVAPLVAPPGVSFPHGLFDFQVGGCGVGATATVQVIFPQALPAGSQYWKYGPTPGPVAAHWYALASGAPNNLVLTATTATFTITDGGLGDDDLSANGIIVDQGGIGFVPVAADLVAVPTISRWNLLLLSGLMLLGFIAVRRSVRSRARQR